jgi:hypothetical protein
MDQPRPTTPGEGTPTLPPQAGLPAGAREAAAPPSIPGLEVREKIGSGGMGSVYRAYQPALDRTVALKTVQPRFLTPEGLDLFRREARALARASHPGIVGLLEFHPEHPTPYFLMEYVDGAPLDRALRGRPWREVAAAFRDVVAAVAWAHGRGVIHGDLKPANILVDRDGRPHILDFGLARVMLQEAVAHGEVGRRGGTLGYLAPEVLAGRAAPGQLSDVFALGVTLYVTLTGVAPFPGLSDLLAGEVRLPLEHNPDIPEPLQRVSLKALEERPEDRYQTAEQMLRDLERFLDDKPLLTRPTHYHRELHGRVDNHLAEVRMWEREGLISRREMDALAGPYQQLQAGDSPWLSETRRVLTGPLLLRAGAWLLLVSALLWPAFYWPQLGRAARLASSGVPTLLMAALGGAFLRLGNRRNALACLGSFSLLLLVFVVVLLAEFRWLEFLQPPEWELWGERLHDRPGGAGDGAGGFLDYFLLSNSQIFVAALTLAGCVALLLGRLRAVFFARWLALAVAGLYAAALLLLGDKERLLDDRVAQVAAHALGLCPLLYLLGLALERRWPQGRDAARAAAPFYRVGAAAGLASALALAWFGTQEWFGQDPEADNEVWNLWLLLYSPPLFLAAWLSERLGTEAQRGVGRALYLLVPVCVLVPLNLLFRDKGPALAALGQYPVRLYELLHLPACLALLLLGRWLHVETFLLAGLAGLAVFLIRVTDLHFGEHLSWPLTVGLLGVGLLGLGIWHTRRAGGARAARRPGAPEAEAATTPFSPG